LGSDLNTRRSTPRTVSVPKWNVPPGKMPMATDEYCRILPQMSASRSERERSAPGAAAAAVGARTRSIL
jgi:hypothetical protein